MDRSTNDHESHPRRSHVARALLALGALYLIAFSAGTAAAAQPLPELPPVDGCVADPSSCLPEAPSVDPCLENPQSCLPEPPPVDKCTADPASCLPDPPPVDECAADPTSCLPEAPRVDQCVEDPARCVTGPAQDVLGGKPADNETKKEEEEEGGGGAVPPKDPGPRRGSKDAGQSDDRDPSASPVPQTDEPLIAAPETKGVSAVGDGPDGILGRLAEGVTDAARRFAFPLGMAALVAAFLLVQGRIDGRDPKLAAAPIDSRDDLVMFR